MKRRFTILATVVAVLIFACSAWACEMPALFGGGSSSGGKSKVGAPKCVLLDDTVYWNAVEGAESYVVELDGEELPAQTDCLFTADKSVDCRVRVKAVDKNGKASAYGNTLLRYADPTELEEIDGSEAGSGETLGGKSGYYLDYSAGGETVFTVESDVRLIKICTGGNYGDMSFVVKERSDQLIFELADGVINAPGDKIAIEATESKQSDRADIVIRSVKGKDGAEPYNCIYGGDNKVNGADGESTTDFGKEGGNGEPGKPGYAAISAHTVAFTGTESVYVKGGAGSFGGRGGDSNSNNGGNGGKGGMGGSAVVGTTVYVNITTGKPIELNGGMGGYGGSKGSVRSPALNFMNSAKNGSQGERGVAFSGETVIISGDVVKE